MAIRLPKFASLGPFTGLRARIVLIIAGLTAFLVVLLGLVMLSIVEHNLLRQKRSQGRFVHVAMQTHFDLLEMPTEGARRASSQSMNNLIKTIIRNLEVKSLVIVDRDQNVIGHSQPEMIGLVLDEADLQRAMSERKLIYRVIGGNANPTEMVFYGPLYRGGSLAGAARFSLMLDDVERIMMETRRLLWLYAILDAVVVILFGSFLLLRVLVLPVETMVNATERMAMGDYRTNLPTQAGSEIGRLGRALSKLATTLQDRESVVKHQMTRLERINTELKQAHDQLLQSDRLAYVGRMAAGVAHEIGNPLGAIYGYLEILRGAELDRQESEVLTRIEAEIKRIDRTMRELLDFSRTKPAETINVDLLDLSRDTVTLMKSQRGLDKVEVHIEPHERLPRVKLDAEQFKQVLLNLLLNAADAMAGEGKIEIAAEVIPYKETQLMEAQLPGAPSEREVPFTDLVKRGIVLAEWTGPREGTRTVQLMVTDNGPGMPFNVLAHVLDPFFTTKPKGKGTGLGLAICQRLISSAGGKMRIESRPGVGTRVTLIYPAIMEETSNV